MADRRLRACVERWTEAETMAYDPRCCRFPKSCSATVYDPDRVDESDLEPVEMTSATPPEAGSVATPQIGSKEYETALLVQRYNDLRAYVLSVTAEDPSCLTPPAGNRQDIPIDTVWPPRWGIAVGNE